NPHASVLQGRAHRARPRARRRTGDARRIGRPPADRRARRTPPRRRRSIDAPGAVGNGDVGLRPTLSGLARVLLRPFGWVDALEQDDRAGFAPHGAIASPRAEAFAEVLQRCALPTLD